eukprot:jgi/Ulvmu1/8351/UM042_0057.1
MRKPTSLCFLAYLFHSISCFCGAGTMMRAACCMHAGQCCMLACWCGELANAVCSHAACSGRMHVRSSSSSSESISLSSGDHLPQVDDVVLRPLHLIRPVHPLGARWQFSEKSNRRAWRLP